MLLQNKEVKGSSRVATSEQRNNIGRLKKWFCEVSGHETLPVRTIIPLHGGFFGTNLHAAIQLKKSFQQRHVVVDPDVETVLKLSSSVFCKS